MLGYPVTAAASAEDAMALVDDGQNEFSILFADINLPGMSGIRLAEMLVDKIPGLHVVFVSGNGFLVADKTNFEFRLLPKPFDLYQVQLVLSDLTLPGFRLPENVCLPLLHK